MTDVLHYLKDWNDIQLHLLFQDKIWMDVNRRKHSLEDMDPGHRRNVLRLLERKSVELFIHNDPPHFDGAVVEDWFERLPLIRKLREYEDALTPIDKLKIWNDDRKWRKANGAS